MRYHKWKPARNKTKQIAGSDPQKIIGIVIALCLSTNIHSPSLTIEFSSFSWAHVHPAKDYISQTLLQLTVAVWLYTIILNNGIYIYIYIHTLFNLYAEYIMWNAGLDEAQAGIKIARRNTNNLRYADDTTLMGESEELKSSWWKWKRRVKKLA